VRHIFASNQTYRQKNCLDLCHQRLIIEKCGCFYPKYGKLGDVIPCQNSTSFDCINECLKELLFTHYDNHLNYEVNKQCNMDCPLECDWISYEIQLSSSDAPTRELFHFYKQFKQTNETFYDYRDDYVSLNVFYPFLESTEVVEMPKMTLNDLFAEIGGSMGIFLGFSVFSIIELLELFVRIVYHLFFKRN
jgi:hypothetical protein